MSGLTTTEMRSVLALAGVFASRMMGLFMIMPVIAIYGKNLYGYTPERIGLAIGIYGLLQAALQIPLGRLSDHFPRKPMILIGMLLFAAGATVSALSTSVQGIIMGRAIQGSGAISAIAMALLADLTPEEHRSQAMAIVGMTIGLSFSVAFIVAPILVGMGGLQAVFWATALMAIGGFVLCLLAVPPSSKTPHSSTVMQRTAWYRLLFHPQMWRIDVTVLCLHAVMATLWLNIPFLLKSQGHLPVHQHAWIYLPILITAFIGCVPFIIIAEKKYYLRTALSGSLLTMITGISIMAEFTSGRTPLIIGLLLYFLSFNLLEALLPSLISKITPAGTRGTSMGVFSTFQFLGPALGGFAGGWLVSQHMELHKILLLTTIPLCICVVLILSMRVILPLKNFVIHFESGTPEDFQHMMQQIAALKGVKENILLAEHQIAYLKADPRFFNLSMLNTYPVRAHISS